MAYAKIAQMVSLSFKYCGSSRLEMSWTTGPNLKKKWINWLSLIRSQHFVGPDLCPNNLHFWQHKTKVPLAKHWVIWTVLVMYYSKCQVKTLVSQSICSLIRVSDWVSGLFSEQSWEETSSKTPLNGHRDEPWREKNCMQSGRSACSAFRE